MARRVFATPEERAAAQAAYKAAYRAEHREEQKAYMAGWLEAHREESKARSRFWRYGITDEDLQRLRDAQNDQCAICGKAWGKRGLVIDHDHKTGRVRGLLCWKCNVGIGNLQDSSDLTDKATTYLRSHDA